MIDRRQLFGVSVGALSAATLGIRRAAAQQVIDRPARLLVGFQPGGSLDAIARMLVEQMKGYAPSLIVDNKPGAAGRIALDGIRTSPPDGSMMILTPSAALAIYPHIYKKLEYDPLNDFQPVTSVGFTSYDIAVGPKVPASVKSMQDFVAWCKANPKEATYGSPGGGTGHHFLGLRLAKATGIELTHVPYRGSAPAIQDLLAGQIASNITVGLNIPLHKEGKIRILGTAGAVRSPILPDVPTFKEQGIAVEAADWFGLVVPKGTPAPLLAKLNETVRAAIASKPVSDLMARLGNTPGGETSEETMARIRRDHAAWGETVKASGFVAEE